MPANHFLNRAGPVAWSALRIAAVVYLALLLVLLFFENTLLYPAPKYPQGDWTSADLPHDDVYFESADGTKLHGWLSEHPSPRAVLMYCHGNAECVGYLGPFMKQLRDEQRLTVFVFDYRGYGRSEGSPHEAGVLADGHAAQIWLAQRTKRRPVDIVLLGRSLGAGVAVDLAANNGARGLILQCAATSIPDVASRIYWFAPVRLIMKNRYDSLSKIGRYTGPVLMSHGSADTLIPCEMGRKLFDAAPCTQKRFLEIEGAGHDDLDSPEYDAALDEFLDSLPAEGL